MRRPSYLFQNGSLTDVLERQAIAARQAVDAIHTNQFLSTPVEDLVEFVVAKMTIEPLVIYEEKMTRRQSEISIDVAGWPGRYTFGEGPCLVPGIRVVVSLPYTGDSDLWTIRPSTFSAVPPFGEVTDNAVEMTFELPTDDSLERIKQRLDENLRGIRQYLTWQQTSVTQFNAALPSQVRTAVQARRSRLQKHDQLATLLNIPLKQDSSAPTFRPVKVEPRIVKTLPPAPSGGFKPEWAISDAEYENILNIIRHEGRTFEATPGTYAVHDEEELRDIILAHLNGHYKGGASGETFRRAGKTDLRIEAEDRAAFVAECKVWRGTRTISDALDQLLGYLTWRDCKAAVIIFNKTVSGFSEIIGKAAEELKAHSRFARMVTSNPDTGEWRAIIRSKDDDARQVHAHVFLFNLYTAGKAAKSKSSFRRR